MTCKLFLWNNEDAHTDR